LEIHEGNKIVLCTMKLSLAIASRTHPRVATLDSLP
jgi:hypothetical protein